MVDKIEHSHLEIRGISLHIAHIGKGDLGTIVFLHGFPEIWYSWRHQMLATAEAGFKAIAPDFRGYGLSGQPPEPEATTWSDLVADLIAMLDLLSIPKAFIVAKDFGGILAYDLAVHHPDRVQIVVALGVPYTDRMVPLDTLPEGMYMHRWLDPGRAEADFGRFDVKRVVRTIYILFSRSEIPIAEEGQEIMDLADLSTPLPQWFTEEDLNAYAALYENSGFRFPLHIPYRSFDKLTDRKNRKVEVPTLLIMGEKDYAFAYPGVEDYVRNGMLNHFVPDLDIVYVPEGCHFVQEQFPEQVNQHLIKFLNNHI